MRQQDRDRCRRHAADPGRLADGARPDRLELLDHLVRQPRDVAIVEVVRETRTPSARASAPPRPPGGAGSPRTSSSISTRSSARRARRRGAARPPARGDLLDRAPVELGPAQQLGERRAPARRSAPTPCRASASLTASVPTTRRARARSCAGRELGAPGLERAPALVIDEAERGGRSASGDRRRCPRAAAAGTRRATSSCGTARRCRASIRSSTSTPT